MNAGRFVREIISRGFCTFPGLGSLGRVGLGCIWVTGNGPMYMSDPVISIIAKIVCIGNSTKITLFKPC